MPVEAGTRTSALTLGEVRDVIALDRRISSLRPEWHYLASLDGWPFVVRDIRAASDKDVQGELKETLPAFTFIGVMDGRSRLVEASGLFTVDIDCDADNRGVFSALGGAEGMKRYVVERVPSVALAFVSPSGTGLKVVHALETVGDYSDVRHSVHDQVFPAFVELYRSLGIEIDGKCKDFNRLCFVSYDRAVYYAPDAHPFVQAVSPPPPPPSPEEIAARLAAARERGVRYGKETRTYRLSRRKTRCPFCGHEGRFKPYVDAADAAIGDAGWCDRVNSCTAHKKPWEADPSVNWVREN